VKSWFYSSLGFCGFSGCVLLGHLAAAYPAIAVGTNTLIVAVLLALAVLTVLSLVKVRQQMGELAERQDYVMSLLTSAGIGSIVLFALLAGAFVVGG